MSSNPVSAGFLSCNKSRMRVHVLDPHELGKIALFFFSSLMSLARRYCSIRSTYWVCSSPSLYSSIVPKVAIIVRVRITRRQMEYRVLTSKVEHNALYSAIIRMINTICNMIFTVTQSTLSQVRCCVRRLYWSTANIRRYADLKVFNNSV